VDAQAQAETGYARKISWIDADSHLERKIEYYDASGTLVKTQGIHSPLEAEPASGKWIALSREMVNHRTGARTLYRIGKFEIGKPIPDSRFSARSLEDF
jgi:outer membrane lipoprotein-sorting protein